MSATKINVLYVPPGLLSSSEDEEQENEQSGDEHDPQDNEQYTVQTMHWEVSIDWMGDGGVGVEDG